RHHGDRGRDGGAAAYRRAGDAAEIAIESGRISYAARHRNLSKNQRLSAWSHGRSQPFAPLRISDGPLLAGGYRLDVRRVRNQPSTDDDEEPSRLDTFPWKLAARAATIGIFFLLFCAVLELARVVLLPVVSAIVIGLMLGPLVGLAS